MAEIFTVEFIERELVDIELAVIDVIPRKTYITELDDITIANPLNGDILIYENGYWANKPLSTQQLNIVFNETPININPLPSKKFKTTYVFESIKVYLNGQKIHDSEITKHSDTEFSYPIDIITSDKVEVSYIKKNG